MHETLVKTEEFKDSPVGKIPNDWEVYTLGECVRPDAPITYGIVQAGSHVEDGVPYIRTGDMAGDRLSLEGLLRTSPQIAASYRRSEVRTGEIVCAIRATVGKVLEVPPELDGANLTQGTARIAPRENLNNHFLLWALRSTYAQRQFDLAVKGTTFSEITLENLRKIYVALPSSRDEQDRIAEILDTVDEAIAHTSSLIAKLKQMKAGLLHDSLTRGLDENGELRDAIAHPEQFKDSPLGLIPKSWQCDVARAFCNDIVVGVVCNATDSYVKHGVPFLRSQNIRLNSIDTNGLLYISPSFNILQSKSILHAGDVVIVRTGYPGTAAVIPDELEGANCFSLIVARPNRTILNSYFFAQYLNSEGCKASIDRAHFGSAQHNFNIGEMDKLLIAVPPLTEQTEIVYRIEALDTRIRKEEAYRDKLKLQKQGLMHDLLTGKVRVKNA